MMAQSSYSFPAKEVEVESPNWLELPIDVTANILLRVGTFDNVTSVCRVCSLWWNIFKDPFMWRTIHVQVQGRVTNFNYINYHPVPICRYAVKRSCGQLEDINIAQFGSDCLLKYITDCSSQLRRLRIAHCSPISVKALNEVAKKLPLLEELDISFNKHIKDSLEVIGRCCLLLKTLRICKRFFDADCDDEAFAIAKTMPGLRHLYISGNLMTNVGLVALLDGCPLLESLDLRECFQLDLRGSLEKRCREQIKYLQLPMD